MVNGMLLFSKPWVDIFRRISGNGVGAGSAAANSLLF
jgi:hypothetical protein